MLSVFRYMVRPEVHWVGPESHDSDVPLPKPSIHHASQRMFDNQQNFQLWVENPPSSSPGNAAHSGSQKQRHMGDVNEIRWGNNYNCIKIMSQM